MSGSTTPSFPPSVCPVFLSSSPGPLFPSSSALASLPTVIALLWAYGGWQALEVRQICQAWSGWLVASGCSCVPRGLEVERNWREVVRVQGHKGEGWLLSPPPLKPGLLSKWQQPGLFLLERSPSGNHRTWAASQHPHPSRATSLARDGVWVLGPSAGQPRSPNSHQPVPGVFLARRRQSLPPST